MEKIIAPAGCTGLAVEIPGHGTYAVATDGVTWHHYDAGREHWLPAREFCGRPITPDMDPRDVLSLLLCAVDGAEYDRLPGRIDDHVAAATPITDSAPWAEPVTLVLFNGRSVAGVRADVDARRADMGIPADAPVLVITRDDDTLPPPDGLPSVSVGEFSPAVGMSYVLIGNGGTTEQLVPVLLRCQRAGRLAAVWSVQRDGSRKLA